LEELSSPLLKVDEQFRSGIIYLFGSVLGDQEAISDIDILVVYDSEEGLVEVSSSLMTLALFAPLDIIIMSADEERFLNFVERQRAKPVREVCRC